MKHKITLISALLLIFIAWALWVIFESYVASSILTIVGAILLAVLGQDYPDDK